MTAKNRIRVEVELTPKPMASQVAEAFNGRVPTLQVRVFRRRGVRIASTYVKVAKPGTTT